MSISTKTGDMGETSLFTGERVKKFDPRITCLGEIDELCSHLGLVKAKLDLPEPYHREFVNSIQTVLFGIMSWIATGSDPAYLPDKNSISELEDAAAKLEASYKKPQGFAVPGGCELSAVIDITRTVARRTERSVNALFADSKTDRTALVYLNRLSDYLFVLARYADSLA